MKLLCFALLVAFSFSTFLSGPEADSFYNYLKDNAPFEVYSPSENPFANYTSEQLYAMFNNNVENPEGLITIEDEELPPINLPASYDFRKSWKQCVSPIKNQGQCGSCWAFAATTSFAERTCVKTKGKLKPSFSAQQQVSCNEENNACNGGYYIRAWNYMQSKGIVKEKCWPYSSFNGVVESCRISCKSGAEKWIKYKARDVHIVKGINSIKTELVTNGPVHVGFIVYQDFMNYKGGIYRHYSGNKVGGHAVVVVGYGKQNGINYWICENSWGPGWGESGYFKIKMGECGIDQYGYVGLPM